MGGYSLIGKTANLHFVILGSNPDISIDLFSSKSSIGRAEHWRCLGYKFKSYFERFYDRCAENW